MYIESYPKLILTALLLTMVILIVDFSLLTSAALNLTNILWRGAFCLGVVFCSLATTRSIIRRAKVIAEIEQDKADNKKTP